MNIGDHFRRLRKAVKNDDFAGKLKGPRGKTQRVGPAVRQPFEKPHGVIVPIPDGTAPKARQPGQRRRLDAGKYLF